MEASGVFFAGEEGISSSVKGSDNEGDATTEVEGERKVLVFDGVLWLGITLALSDKGELGER